MEYIVQMANLGVAGAQVVLMAIIIKYGYKILSNHLDHLGKSIDNNTQALKDIHNIISKCQR